MTRPPALKISPRPSTPRRPRPHLRGRRRARAEGRPRPLAPIPGDRGVRPNTRFTWSGGYAIAYQVVGDGVRDLVYLPGWASNVDISWDVPPIARFLEGLSSFSRLILLDRRGVGWSDRD